MDSLPWFTSMYRRFPETNKEPDCPGNGGCGARNFSFHFISFAIFEVLIMAFICADLSIGWVSLVAQW